MASLFKPTAPDASRSAPPNPSVVSPTPAVAATAPTPSAQAPSTPRPSTAVPPPSAEEIREYAHHLYVLRGSAHGHEGDDWLEAEACLRASIPKESLRTRMHHHSQITEREVLPLVKHGRS